ncbi:TIGR02285 family protein [Pontibacter sp. JAM-7]|uniref:TIGR02285 family protein n=1 Tax=Pontibacter sp. JAM-7 TaxID=3366581 RepID=UPI003AF65995
MTRFNTFLLSSAKACCLLTSLCLLTSAQVQAERTLPQVTWSRTDFAPYFIVQGPYENQGISDKVIQLLISQIPSYQHQAIVMTLPRMLNDAQQGKPICHASLLKTQAREAFIEYSDPVMINYANGIITSAAGLQKFGMSPETITDIDLASLRGKPLSIMVYQGRSYAPHIDQIIAEDRRTDNSIFRVKSGTSEHDRLIRQLFAKRLDGFMGRPEEAYFDSVSHHIRQKLYLIGLTGQPRTSVTRIGCTKGSWNDDLLKEINRLVKTKTMRQAINKAYINWLPEQLRGSYVMDQAIHFAPDTLVFNQQ